MLDVIVRLFRNGMIFNSNDRSGKQTDDSTAVLGKAKLGIMKLGK